MSAPIDVLSAMDVDIADTQLRIDRGQLPLSVYDQLNDKREARAAVAELIKAADAATSECGAIDCPSCDRVRAALARIGGAK